MIEYFDQGKGYVVVRDDRMWKAIGIIQIVPDGFLANNHRKPVSTMEDAAVQLIDSNIKSLKKEIETLLKLRGELICTY